MDGLDKNKTSKQGGYVRVDDYKNKNKKIVFWKESPRKNYKHKTKYLNII